MADLAQTSTHKWKQYRSSTKTKTATVKTSSGVVRKIFVHNTNAGVQYAQLHDALTPATAAIRAVKAVPTAGNAEFDFPDGWQCDTGILVVLSTAQDTYAAPGADDGMFTVQYA